VIPVLAAIAGEVVVLVASFANAVSADSYGVPVSESFTAISAGEVVSVVAGRADAVAVGDGDEIIGEAFFSAVLALGVDETVVALSTPEACGISSDGDFFSAWNCRAAIVAGNNYLCGIWHGLTLFLFGWFTVRYYSDKSSATTTNAPTQKPAKKLTGSRMINRMVIMAWNVWR
jgi:hypothetical protein